MTIPRLLILGSLLSLCVAAAAAQASPPSAPDSSQPASVLSQNAESEHDSGKMPAPVHTQHILTMEQNEATCYALRTYRVARVSPESDTVRPAGYSTCQRATRFQLRTAVESKEIESR